MRQKTRYSKTTNEYKLRHDISIEFKYEVCIIHTVTMSSVSTLTYCICVYLSAVHLTYHMINDN